MMTVRLRASMDSCSCIFIYEEVRIYGATAAPDMIIGSRYQKKKTEVVLHSAGILECHGLCDVVDPCKFHCVWDVIEGNLSVVLDGVL